METIIEINKANLFKKMGKSILQTCDYKIFIDKDLYLMVYDSIIYEFIEHFNKEIK